MEKIKSEQISMKPKWMFILGSVFTIAGFIGLTAGAIFLANITIFLIRKRGPGYGRLELMLNSFPIWIPIMAITGIVLGIWILKKYDFSYKKNFLLIAISFVISVVVAGLLVDRLGFNNILSHQQPMRNFYQQIEERSNFYPGRFDGEMMKNRRGNKF